MDWDGGGGGFMNDSIADEPQQLSNNVSVGVEERSKAIASVSVSQIAKLTRPNDGGLVIHGKKIYHVKLIAHIREVLDNNSQKIHILVDDYTAGGPLEVSHIIGDTGVPTDEFNMFSEGDGMGESVGPKKTVNQLKIGDYVRCIGVVKYNQDMPNVVAYDLQYVEDPNDITVHHLEVIRDSMYLEKNPTGMAGMSSSLNGKQNNMNSANQPAKSNVEFGNLSNREKLVLKFLRDNTNIAGDKGVHINKIAECLKAFSRGEIETSLTILNSEGQCWQGDSEEEWCANVAE